MVEISHKTAIGRLGDGFSIDENGVISIDENIGIHVASPESSVSDTDEVLIYVVTASENRKVTLADLKTYITA